MPDLKTWVKYCTCTNKKAPSVQYVDNSGLKRIRECYS